MQANTFMIQDVPMIAEQGNPQAHRLPGILSHAAFLASSTCGWSLPVFVFGALRARMACDGLCGAMFWLCAAILLQTPLAAGEALVLFPQLLQINRPRSFADGPSRVATVAAEQCRSGNICYDLEGGLRRQGSGIPGVWCLHPWRHPAFTGLLLAAGPPRVP